MKKGWLYSLLGIFLCLLTLGGVTINSIYRIQRHGSLINYTGIVRGASQKLIKMELNDIQGDDLILYIDEILDSLTEGSGVYDLPLPDDENYQSKLGKTKEAWEQIKKQIYITRKDSGNMAAKNQLLQDSEQFFNTTNDMVFAAESFTNQHARRLMLLDIIMFACVLALWIFIFITNIRKILRLETSNRELKDTAGRDSLTRAYTLEYFISQAQELMKQQTELNYALFYVDFSDFKYINDVFGYARGDDMLRQYAALLIEDKKAYELVGRINADNFIILRHYENRTELTKRQSAVD
ncbi:MAG: GGDEF domain-containing protein, partial [Clostridium sp.]